MNKILKALRAVRDFIARQPLMNVLLSIFLVALIVLFASFISSGTRKLFTMMINIFILSGIILTAKGAVISNQLRNKLYDIKDGKSNEGISDKEMAKIFIDTSDSCEAGTIIIIIGTVLLVIDLFLN
ncbi:hypothetical protein ACDI35_10560 [Xanthomonas axonopodis pv. cajani]|uniref:hypothetical protein n=1 Tax=Xanthomonas axonopodis TaxID=53413 RepID=UPI003557475F